MLKARRNRARSPRRVMGTTVIGGMLVATLIAIFLIPVTYYVVERFADRRGERAGHCARWRELSGSASARLRRVHAGCPSRDN
jgi:hypothetical protein